MTPDQLPPLPESGASAGWPYSTPSWEPAYNAAQMTAYGLQCAEAAVERYAAKVREAVQAVMEEEKRERDRAVSGSDAVEMHRYAIYTCIDIKERLLQIK